MDLESLRKKTFHGVKRPTVILIVEKSAPSADDDVVLTTLFMDCHDRATDTVDFSKARRETLKRSELKQTRYLPTTEKLKFWAIDSFGTPDEAPITSKIVKADVPVLDALRDAPRLGDIVQIAYSRRLKQGRKKVSLHIPPGQSPAGWEPYLMMAPGIQLGGAKALLKTGWPIYKGQNIFTSGILGEPMGFWDPEKSVTDQERILGYRSLFDSSSLFAIRNISQLPTACRVPANTGFQNTAHLVQLNEPFPLHLYLLSRIPQWYCAKLLRSNVVEDLAATWSKKQLAMIPVPRKRAIEVNAQIIAAGNEVLRADKDIANSDRHVEELLKHAQQRTIFTLFATNSPFTAGLDVGSIQGTEAGLTGVREEGDKIIADNLFLRIVVPDPLLRRYLVWVFERMLDSEPDRMISVSDFGNIEIPSNLEDVVKAIDQLRSANPVTAFHGAIDNLDRVVADAFELSEDDMSHIRTAMLEDKFLKQLQPMHEHRGIRLQPYSDHSESDRYS